MTMPVALNCRQKSGVICFFFFVIEEIEHGGKEEGAIF